MDPFFIPLDNPPDDMISAQADSAAGSAGHSSSPWPAGPVWAPPATQLGTSSVPPIGQSLPGEASRPTPPALPKRRWPTIAAASILVAGLVGGGAGYVGASLASTGSAKTSAPAAAPLAYTSAGMNVASVVKAAEPAVVTIKTTIEVRQGRQSFSGEAAGTGVILTADGQILTNAHVVADATSITVTLNGETTPRKAVLIGADTASDVALVKLVGASGLPVVKIGNSDAVAVGDDVVAIGNALDLAGGVTVTKGIISALDRKITVEAGDLSHLIQTDAAISSGNSGGPLLNAAGEIIGMNTAGATSSQSVTAENIGFAIPINDAMTVVARLRSAA